MRRMLVRAFLFPALLVLGCGLFGGVEPELVGVSYSTDSELFGDYKMIVHCTVRNNGDDGDIEIIADLRTDEGQWRKRQTIFVAADSEEKVDIVFPEPTWGAELATVEKPFECSASSG